ncbi:hypothetical protein PRVXT_002247 [Proteinivorax tanatarense]|uniref:Bacteriocin biosynthesis cyclodehydratase domain-containing protein n=1 Tax=Proteinivorax tanatarense TaxID=1260629 RepID=A0AAU7VK01_9FIRM
MTKHIIDPKVKIIKLSDDVVIFNKFGRVYKLRGQGIKKLIQEVYKVIEDKGDLKLTEHSLLEKYSEKNVVKILEFMKSERIIIESYDGQSKDLDMLYSIVDKGSGKTLEKNRLFFIVSNEFEKELLQDNNLLKKFEQVNILNVDNKKMHNTRVENISNEIELNMPKNDLTIVLLEDWDDSILSIVNNCAIASNSVWIKGIIDEFKVEIGPFHIPKTTPCYICNKSSLEKGLDKEDLLVFSEKLKSETRYYLSPAINITMGIIFLEIIKYLSKVSSDLLTKNLTFDYLNLRIDKTYVLKQYFCNKCGKGVEV